MIGEDQQIQTIQYVGIPPFTDARKARRRAMPLKKDERTMEMKHRKIRMMLLLVLLMIFSISTVHASVTYPCLFMSYEIMTSDAIQSSGYNRALGAAGVLLDYLLSADKTDEVAGKIGTGYGFVADFGTCSDFYYPCWDGSYLNLFYSPYSQEITDYGYGKFYNSNEHEYKTFSISDMVTILENLSNEMDDSAQSL